jgi:hypothetical protein
MRLVVDGQEYPLKNMQTAPVIYVLELQKQTGWKGNQIKERIDEADLLAAPISLFLTLAAAGQKPSWTDCFARPLGDYEILQDPEDEAREADEKGTADPQ